MRKQIPQLFVAFLWVMLLSGSLTFLSPEDARLHDFTTAREFDYFTWTLKAAFVKWEQYALDSPKYFDADSQKDIIASWLNLTDELMRTESRLSEIYADPSIEDPEAASADIRAHLEDVQREQRRLAPFAESILQAQITRTLDEAGLATAGQPLPPVLYRVTSTPLALIISPRDHIEQKANISLVSDLTIAEQDALENQISQALDVSALVVPVGGIGVYPTMVMQTTNLPWMLETIAHEWTHNYLDWHPLGRNYDTTPELRTMNETTAMIVGKEIGSATLRRDYPERAFGSVLARPPIQPNETNPTIGCPPPFDFRLEMHKTRVHVDELLAEGKIEEAEAYMNMRRQVFWNHGYAIRKLNQAYFAFYGAYADVPGGAAGEDPVGPAVRELRRKCGTLANFVHTIAEMDSFEDLQETLRSMP